MTEVEPRPTPTNQRRSSTGVRWIVVLTIAGLVPLFFISLLLALSIDEYQSYTTAVAEYGNDTAALHAGEALFGIQFSSFVLAVAWLFLTGVAATIAAGTKLPVLRTVLLVGGSLAASVGLLLFLGLTIGTA